jgi:hypothetical protein
VDKLSRLVTRKSAEKILEHLGNVSKE